MYSNAYWPAPIELGNLSDPPLHLHLSQETKLIFPTDDSLLKMLYLACGNISKRWTMVYTSWDNVISQLHIVFDDILNGA